MVKKEIRDIIKRFIRELEKEGIKVDKVFFFGSYSRGAEREDSDIDVAIISKDFGKDITEENMKLWRIAVRIDVRLSPIALTPHDLEKSYIPIIPEIKKGIEIVP